MRIRHNIILVALFLSGTALGSGFSLYEPSVPSHALGGALVGKAIDASANFNNPATLTDLTNIVVTVGFVTEHPRGAVRVNGHEFGMDPGFFTLPHFQLAIPLPADFSFGLSASAEYGLGTEYSWTWPMNWSTIETTVQGYVLNPNLAYKITDDWSIGIGARWLFFDFEMNSMPQTAMGSFSSRLKGDNQFRDVGWQIGTKYDITDEFSVGLVYKSAIDTHVYGSSRTGFMYADNPVVRGNMRAINGDADAGLRLPQSLSGGFNWDFAKDWHFGAALSWTQWSVFDSLTFNLNNYKKPIQLNWHDTWRGSFGLAWDFDEDWTAMLGYVYDMDCTDSTQTSTMLPAADRHIASCGVTWRCWKGLELSLSYSCIFTHGYDMHMKDAFGKFYYMDTCRGFCHAAGFSVTYRF